MYKPGAPRPGYWMGELEAFAARYQWTRPVAIGDIASVAAWRLGRATRTRRSPWRCCVPTLTKRRSTLADYEGATETDAGRDDRIVIQGAHRRHPAQPEQPATPAPTGLRTLAASIADGHLLQPVLYAAAGERYELIAGHRRLEAVKPIGWTGD